jgi:hypothetical protein
MDSVLAVRDGFRMVRRLLADLLTDTPNVGPRIAELLHAVDELERAVETVGPPAPTETRRATRGKAKNYTVERSGDDEVLTEQRPDDPNPFRCPRSTYDAVARVLARLDRPAKYAEIAKAVAKELRPAPADYQIRVVLRFWADRSVGLIERARARYRPLDSTRLMRLATEAWRRAAHGAAQ